MANVSNSTWVVRVTWQAIPESMNYYDLDPASSPVVDQKYMAQVNSLIPPGDQARWQNLVFSVSNLDELATKTNTLLKSEVTPPAGTELLLAEAVGVWRPIPPLGHAIEQFAMIRDVGTTPTRHWSFAVSHGGATYTARMGLSYECLHARVP